MLVYEECKPFNEGCDDQWDTLYIQKMSTTNIVRLLLVLRRDWNLTCPSWEIFIRSSRAETQPQRLTNARLRSYGGKRRPVVVQKLTLCVSDRKILEAV